MKAYNDDFKEHKRWILLRMTGWELRGGCERGSISPLGHAKESRVCHQDAPDRQLKHQVKDPLAVAKEISCGGPAWRWMPVRKLVQFRQEILVAWRGVERQESV